MLRAARSTESLATVVVLVVMGLLYCTIAGATDPSTGETGEQILERSYAALGGRTPDQATLSGAVSVTSGGESSSGKLRVLASGYQKTNESFETSNGVTEARFNAGDLLLFEDGAATRPSREFAVSGQSSFFPTVLISRALQGEDMAVAYLGDEVVEGGVAKRVRVWDTYSRDPDSDFLADLSAFDIWVSASTDLPLMLRRERRQARGAAYGTIYEFRYADYQSFDGDQVPTRVTAARNYVDWVEWSISSVSWTDPLPADAFEITGEN